MLLNTRLMSNTEKIPVNTPHKEDDPDDFRSGADFSFFEDREDLGHDYFWLVSIHLIVFNSGPTQNGFFVH